jgi:hypothetical protein
MALGWLVLALLSYVPLMIHELGSNASELRAAVAFVTGGGGPATIALPARLPIVGLRVLGWPLTGLITAAPLATVLAAALVISLAIWRGWPAREQPRRGEDQADTDGRAADDTDDERTAVRWLALGLAWTVVALAIGASSLATIVAGLPNDHYHAFADPMVVVLVAVGLAALINQGVTAGRGAGPAAINGALAAVVVVALVGWNLATQPPAAAPDGGWQAAQAAANRVITAASGGPLVLASLPTFKSDEALRMPLVAAAVEVMPPGVNGASFGGPTAIRVIICDQLFRQAIGADCGGPAEDAWLADPASGLAGGGLSRDGPRAVIDRFEAAPGRWISVYRP